MKLHYRLLGCCLIYLALSVNYQNKVYAQQDFLGSWEGMFMNDFKVILEFTSDGKAEFSGSIKMFAGPEVLQDDKLTEIHQMDIDVSFYIPDKQTRFKGQFNNDVNELSGFFIFPDGTEHP